MTGQVSQVALVDEERLMFQMREALTRSVAEKEPGKEVGRERPEGSVVVLSEFRKR